jgi:hypothetical protein
MSDSHDDKVTTLASARRRLNRSGSKTRAVSFSVTTQERAAIEAAAKRDGLSVSEYLRCVLLPDVYPQVQTVLTGLVTDLHRVGDHIDALVRHMEKGDLPEMPEVRDAQKQSREAIAEFLRAVDGGSH